MAQPDREKEWEVERMSVRVLIADSSGSARGVIRNHLECLGCDVVAEAETASQALNLFRVVKPDVVALKVGLPRSADLDSLALFRSIRRESPRASVLILSATEAPEVEDMFLREGALDCIVEPLDTEGFERMWRSLSAVYPELKNPPTPPRRG